MAESEKKEIIEEIGIPRNKQEVNRLLAEMEEIGKMIQEVDSARNEEISRINQDAEEMIRPLKKSHELAGNNIFKFAAKHRSELTENDKRKYAEFATAVLRWRWGQPKIRMSASEINIVDQLLEMRQGRFIDWIPKIRKKELLSRPDVVSALKGVNIVQEEFLRIVFKKVQTTLRIRTSSRKK